MIGNLFFLMDNFLRCWLYWRKDIGVCLQIDHNSNYCCIIIMFSSFKKDKWTNFELLWAFRQGWTDDFYLPWKGRGYRQLGTNNIAVFVGSSLHLFSSAWKYSFLNLLLQNSLLRTGIVGLAGGLDGKLYPPHPW